VAVANLAWFSVVYSIAVTEVQAVECTEPPDRMLKKSRKIGRKSGIDRSSIDALRNASDYFGATTFLVAGRAVSVRSATVEKDAGSVKEIVNEGIDGDHRFPCLEPDRSPLSCYQ
jgi:hypothetical protein